MSSTETPGIEVELANLPGYVGRHLGYTDWEPMEQQRVDLFADATDDHQYIHVDPVRARESPFGRTVAHGFLTLSLVASVSDRLLRVTDRTTAVNYGLQRVRFPAPLPVGARWRGGLELRECGEVPGGLQLLVRVTIEVEGSDKPALVADWITRQYA